MGYITYIFNLFFNIANKIKIPIPLSENNVYYLSIYSIFIGMIVVGVIVWFVARLLNFEINWSFKQLGKLQDDNFNIKQDVKQSSSYSNKKVRNGNIRKSI